MEFYWNEKYRGCVSLQKTFVENYLEHKQVKNIGQLDMFHVDFNHAAIIYAENWTQKTGASYVQSYVFSHK